MIFCSAVKCNATDFVIVDVSQQIYSYDSLCEDMAILAAGHEDIMSYESLSTTSQGRNVWLVKYGNLQADKRILITASIHAREYMTSQLVMRMLEEYVLNVDTPQADGNTYRQLFSGTCLYIMPMVNPDGVDLVTGEITPNTSLYTNTQLIAKHFPNIPFPDGWKANIRGVDLNLQFPAGWAQARQIKYSQGFTSPAPRDFVGFGPLTEPESLAIYNFTLQHNFNLVIAFHTQGNVIFWQFQNYNPPRSLYIGNQLAAVSRI